MGKRQLLSLKQQSVEQRGETSAPLESDPANAADRDFPNRLSGEALRRLAHQRGLARSSLEGMTDTKIREQLRYILQRQYEEP